MRLNSPLLVRGRRRYDQAGADAILLALTGEPIDKPVFSHGPCVMNTEA